MDFAIIILIYLICICLFINFSFIFATVPSGAQKGARGIDMRPGGGNMLISSI
jgi:hypothetical protein